MSLDVTLLLNMLHISIVYYFDIISASLALEVREGGSVLIFFRFYYVNKVDGTSDLGCTHVCPSSRHGPLALDALLVSKISKRHFFQDIKNSFHGVLEWV